MRERKTVRSRMYDNHSNEFEARGPVFICGCGRSGTTYVKSVIDAHPDIHIPTESLFLADYLIYENYVPNHLLAWLFFREPQLRSWYSGPAFEIHTVREAIIRVHMDTSKKRGAIRWGQKTPRFVRFIDLFNHAFRDIQWILIYRDPRAVTASMLKSKRHTYSVSRACRRWNRDNRPILDLLKDSKQIDHILILKYEDFVAHFEEILTTIFNFLHLSPLSKQEVLRSGTTPTFKGSRFDGSAVRAGLAPQKDIIDHWKTYLTEDQIRKIELLCGDGMKKLGYPSFFTKPDSSPLRRKCDFLRGLKDFLIVFEYLRKWPSYLFMTLLRKFLFLFYYYRSKLTR